MKTRSRNLTTTFFFGLIIIGMCWGCAGVEQKFDVWQSAIREKLNFETSEADASAKDSRDEYFIHTSKWSWETLAYVAEWYTGDVKNEKNLVAINPAVNPQEIAVGSQIRIPADLLKTRQPLPKNFSGAYREDFYKHTVHWPGETLSLIASWYTGSSKNWRKLAAANPRLNPNRIKSGNIIYIPPSLLKTRVPLPQKVAAKYTSDYFAYTVKRDNEKLEDIARWYTGNPANRKLLAKTNPDLNPDHLKLGDEVYIPEKLLKNRKPLPPPESATADSKPAAKTPPAEPDERPASDEKQAPDEKSAPDEKIKLFGPKQFPQN
ncbi:MAG: LysM peptidoglycan-binding domain-containing protein [Desulfobacterales bacterium]|nr:MAG: LysM peptidoglycan-binding domain-containing protein [Desulfobacterales bacterium]